jgi:predicted Zn-dependent protease
MGVQSAPQMAAQFGGLAQDPQGAALVKAVGAKLAQGTEAAQAPYKFDYHLLADPRTINAFALPGGQIFITEGLLRLLRTEGEVASVLGHETGHVVARHSAEHLAKEALTQGLVGAVVVGSGDMNTAPDRAAGRRARQHEVRPGRRAGSRCARYPSGGPGGL